MATRHSHCFGCLPRLCRSKENIASPVHIRSNRKRLGLMGRAFQMSQPSDLLLTRTRSCNES